MYILKLMINKLFSNFRAWAGELRRAPCTVKCGRWFFLVRLSPRQLHLNGAEAQKSAISGA